MSIASSSSTLKNPLLPSPSEPSPSSSLTPSLFLPEPSTSSSLPDPSRMSLEFLSFLQTDEIIPIHKITGVIIPALLQNMGRWNDERSPLQAKNEKVCGDLSIIKKKLDRLKEWEDQLNTLTKKLILCVWESVEDSQVAIRDIDEMVSALRSLVSLPFKSTLAAEPSDIYPPLKTSLAATSSDISDVSVPKNAISILTWSRNFPKTEAFVDFKARYDTLTYHQQQSLWYFSFFPKNSVIRKKVLTYLWIGEGVIHSPATEDSEEIADRLFKDLVEKRFIDPVEEKDIGDFNLCSINPDIQPALLTIAHSMDFFGLDSDGNPTAHSRRACLVETEEGSLQHLYTFSNHDKLLTLFNIDENCIDFPNLWLSKTKNISVIHLGSWSSSSTDSYIEAENPNFLEDLRDAKRLRCLSLNGISGITKLPDSISTFDELNILELKSCLGLEKLPRDIHLLKKLTLLDISGCYLLDEMPTGIASLSELRILKGFVICRSKEGTKQCTLRDLVKLERLRKLSIYADKETTGENGELNCLSEFRSLRILAISWIAPVPPRSKPNKKLQSTSVASPSLPASLEKLDLRCWPLPTMPSWIKQCELNSLKKLYIRGGKLSGMQIVGGEGCPRCESSHWMVKILRLKFLRELKMEWEEVGTLFPSLVYLEKVDCPKLLSFPFEGRKIFKTKGTSR